MCSSIFQTEQVSHHPPISSFWIGCPSKGIEGCGIDQISARVAGTSLKVGCFPKCGSQPELTCYIQVLPGSFNKGIFLEIKSGNGAGEAYRITQPVACVNGILRGSMYGTISESVRLSSVFRTSSQLVPNLSGHHHLHKSRWSTHAGDSRIQGRSEHTSTSAPR